jgi:hypothetical protein
MRLWGPALSFVVASACVTVAPSSQVALVPLPGVPASVRGATGIGLAGRIALASPSSGTKGDAVAIPQIQPELNGLIKFGENGYGMMQLLVAPGGSTLTPRGNLPASQGAFDVGGMVGMGWDFRFGQRFGIQISGELGFQMVLVTTVTTGSSVKPILMFAARGALSPFVDLGPVRIFAAAALGTDTFSEEKGVETVDCSAGFCSSSNTARTDLTSIVTVGGGARYLATSFLAIAVEVWAPLSTGGIRQPPQLALSFQLGNFDFSRSKREAAEKQEPPSEPLPAYIPPPPQPELSPPVVPPPPPLPPEPNVAPPPQL